MKHEYIVRVAEGPLEPMLNEYAKDGWRFVWCTTGMSQMAPGSPMQQRWYVVFERETEK